VNDTSAEAERGVSGVKESADLMCVNDLGAKFAEYRSQSPEQAELQTWRFVETDEAAPKLFDARTQLARALDAHDGNRLAHYAAKANLIDDVPFRTSDIQREHNVRHPQRRARRL
jgi:hypothetical protein